MKRVLSAALAISMLSGAVMAQPHGGPNADQNGDPAGKSKANDKGNAKGKGKGEAPAAAAPAAPAKDAPPAKPDRGPPQDRPAPQAQKAQRQQQPAPQVVAQPQPQVTAQPQPRVRQATPQIQRGVSPQEAAPAKKGGMLSQMAQQQQQQQQKPQPAPQRQRQVQPAPVQQYAPPPPPSRGYWARGERLPAPYLQNQQYQVSNYSQWGLRRPPSGQRWMRDNNNSFYLVVIATGLVADSLYRNDRDRSWDQRHTRTYSYNDDVYYQQCRTSVDPAGVIAGALIGGLIGNAVGSRSDRGNATTAGVILGGVLGAAMTKNMDCNDRSYAYKTYYNGFNAGRPGARYQWTNPQNNHRGEFTVGRYYNDPDSFRCADFTQVIYINGRPENAHGTACRQPDGSWVIVNEG